MGIGSMFTSASDFLFRLLFKFLFRYDVFISYARRDGKDYALKLRDQLKALDFSCFLDFDELPAGNSLNKTLKRAIRKSATLIVVGTERATKSRYVELEIGEFAKTNRAIIPIDIGGTLADPPWSVIKERDIVWIDETAESLVKGVPSPNVADSIDKLFKYTRRNTRVRGQVFATMLLFLAGAALAIFLIQGKVKALNVANVAAQEERQRAVDATAVAEKQEEKAKLEEARAREAIVEANAQRESAAKFAATAKKKAEEALANARKAEASAKRAEEQRLISLGRRLYTDSRNALDETGEGLELSALLTIESLKSTWTQDAYETWAKVMEKLPDPTDDIRMEVEGAAYAIAFSPNGNLVAIGGDSGLTLCKASDGKRVNQIAPNGRVHAVSFSPDGQLIAIGSGNEVSILNADNLKTIKTLPEIADERMDVTFSPDGLYLATASRKEKAHVFDTKNWKEVCTPELEGGGIIMNIAFSLDSEYLILAGSGKLRMWEIKGENKFGFLTDEDLLLDMAVGVPITPGVPIALATAGDNGTAKLWSIKKSNDGTEYVRVENEHDFKMTEGSLTKAVAFSPDGRYLASAGMDRTARIWDVVTKTERTRKVYADPVLTLAFSPDGKWIATGAVNESRVWKMQSSTGVRRLEHTESVLTSAFSSNSDLMATLSWDQMIRIFDTANWKELRAIKSKFQASDLVFSPDGKWLATTGDGRVDLYDSLKLNEVASKVFSTEKQGAQVPRIFFSPDGRWLAATYRNDVHLMAIQTKQWVTRIEHKDSIEKIGFSADGKYVLTQTPRDNDRAVLIRPTMIRVWESATGKEVAWKSLEDEDAKASARRPPVSDRSKDDDFPLEKQGGRVELLSHADALKELRSYKLNEVSSADGLWKAAKRMQGLPPLLKEAIHDKTVAELKHDEYVNDLVFSPNSRWLVTASRDHTVRVWPLTPKDMIDEACARLNRNLNDKEKELYFRGERVGKTCPNLP